MSKENRFERLMGAVGKKRNVQTSKHSDVQKSDSNQSTTPIEEQTNQDTTKTTSKHSDAQTSKAKSVNPDYVRTTVYLPKTMHKKLKAIAVEEEKEMSGIVEELIDTWLKSRY